MRSAEENQAVASAYELAAKSRAAEIKSAQREAWNEAIEAMVELAATKGWGMRDDEPFEDAVREIADELLPHREGQ